ncbi:MAG: type III pantothenate kinase [Flavobacteriaceae bacterium]
MNLSIDIGNSRVKLAVFKNDACLIIGITTKENLLKKVESIKESYNIKHTIVASVSNIKKEILNKIKSFFKVIILNTDLKFPFLIAYKTKETLGVDRLALMAAAIKKYPYKNVLVIDAGTCITYDFISKEAHYLGGSISPGVLMRYKALNNQTDNLPFLDPKYPNNFIGNSTKQSIHSGVIFGVINEIEGIIRQYKAKYSNLTVVLTGGDTNFLSEKLKSGIFANPNFLLEGLNHILNYNLQE